MDDRIIITYCLVDDFCKFCDQKKLLAKPDVQIRKPTRVPKTTHSEIITILLVYQRSHFKDFRNFYGYFRNAYSHFFPNLPTYERFNELQKRVLYLLMLFMKALLVRGSTEGYIDSTKIDVCHLKRSKRNKVFAETAAAGYSSMGMVLNCTLL